MLTRKLAARKKKGRGRNRQEEGNGAAFASAGFGDGISEVQIERERERYILLHTACDSVNASRRARGRLCSRNINERERERSADRSISGIYGTNDGEDVTSGHESSLLGCPDNDGTAGNSSPLSYLSQGRVAYLLRGISRPGL